ncbi:hypothetical protein [Helicobacter sp.]|uniref:hypothetical protein n=1 Tax=Helicobacter sp. TaxID=218 RepID=UPI00199738F0|nr:hypothetical protein [Helicobacter sp.]MBD5165220.1 hypothetical protein [Helicobacter sp.]
MFDSLPQDLFYQMSDHLCLESPKQEYFIPINTLYSPYNLNTQGIIEIKIEGKNSILNTNFSDRADNDNTSYEMENYDLNNEENEIKKIRNMIEKRFDCKVQSLSKFKDETGKTDIIFNTDLPEMTTDEIYNINQKFYNLLANNQYIGSVLIL